MAWTYLLECADGSLYVGSTRDLDARVAQHQAGTGSAYTRCRLPVSLAWAAEFEHVGEAFAFEKQVQNWGRAKRLALIDGRLDDLVRLARGSDRDAWDAAHPRPGLEPEVVSTPLDHRTTLRSITDQHAARPPTTRGLDSARPPNNTPLDHRVSGG
jgi:putative endonuclease